jgi:hypothetical protein
VAPSVGTRGRIHVGILGRDRRRAPACGILPVTFDNFLNTV